MISLDYNKQIILNLYIGAELLGMDTIALDENATSNEISQFQNSMQAYVASKDLSTLNPLDRLGLYIMFDKHEVIAAEITNVIVNDSLFLNIQGNNSFYNKVDNLLSLAVLFKNIPALKLLLSTDAFKKEQDYVRALQIAATFNIHEVVPIFAENGYNLFAHAPMENTPLITACENENLEFITAILETNPSEQDLTHRGYNDSMICQGAFDIVYLSSNAGLKNLFNNITSYKSYCLIFAVLAQNIDECRRLLTNVEGENLLIKKLEGNSSTFLSQSYEALVDDVLIQLLDQYLTRLPISEQIKTLIITLSCVSHLSRGIERTQNYLNYLEQISLVRDENARFDDLPLPYIQNIFRINNNFEQHIAPKFWESILRIIKIYNIEKIEFNKPCQSDNRLFDNLSPKFAMKFVNDLLTNTSIKECDMQLQGALLPLSDIVKMICLRNKDMVRAKSKIAQEKIYDLSRISMNNLINLLKSDNDIDEDARCELQLVAKKPDRCFSLVEYAAFSIWKNQSLFEEFPKEVEEVEKLPVFFSQSNT